MQFINFRKKHYGNPQQTRELKLTTELVESYQWLVCYILEYWIKMKRPLKSKTTKRLIQQNISNG